MNESNSHQLSKSQTSNPNLTLAILFDKTPAGTASLPGYLGVVHSV
jgi:hypothetical protein